MKRALGKLLFAVAVLTAMPACLEQSTTVSDEFAVLPNPALTIGNIPSILPGNSPYQLSFSAKAASALTIKSTTIEYAADAVTFTPLASLPGGATTYLWTTPAQDIASARLRFTTMDNQGRTTTQLSTVFEISNSPPLFTMAQSGTQLITNQPVTYSGTCKSNFPIQVQITGQLTKSAILPKSLDGFQCNSGQWSYTFTPTADNIYGFNFKEIDPVGTAPLSAESRCGKPTANDQRAYY